MFDATCLPAESDSIVCARSPSTYGRSTLPIRRRDLAPSESADLGVDGDGVVTGYPGLWVLRHG